MKTINVTFEDEEYEFLAKAKNGRSWREFILRDYISDKDINKFKNEQFKKINIKKGGGRE